MNATKKWRLSMLKKGGQVCRYCHSRKYLTTDHIHPKSRGGTEKRHNFQLLCKDCNYKKGSLTDFEVASLFREIEERGVWYKWEQKYADWLESIKQSRKTPLAF